jgi:hypothetical protein
MMWLSKLVGWNRVEMRPGHILMDQTELKTALDAVAKAHGFASAHGGWWRDSPLALITLSLQRSNFANSCYLNMKLHIGKSAACDARELKRFIKTSSGDVFRTQGREFDQFFDLDSSITPEDRLRGLERLFLELIRLILTACGSPEGVLRLRDQGVLFLLPMAEKRLTDMARVGAPAYGPFARRTNPPEASGSAPPGDVI